MLFIGDEFLMESEVARDLYHRYVKSLPIVDYHCHLPVTQIASNQAWAKTVPATMRNPLHRWTHTRPARAGRLLLQRTRLPRLGNPATS